MCKSSLVLVAALAVCLGLATPAFAQKSKVRPAGTSTAKTKSPNLPDTAKEKIEKEKAEADELLSPAKQASRERLKKAEEHYKWINIQVEAHENRIRLQRSIRIPPGVRPPQID